jgi:hypothetical protein
MLADRFRGRTGCKPAADQQIFHVKSIHLLTTQKGAVDDIRLIGSS